MSHRRPGASLAIRKSSKVTRRESFTSRAACSFLSVLFQSLFKEKERELCVRERLAENKLARAEGLLKNYSLLKEQKFLSLVGGPGMRASSEQELLPALAFQSPEL